MLKRLHSTQVPFYRPSLTVPEISEVLDCMKSSWLTTGPTTKQFEQEFAHYLEQNHAVALNSCTAALHLAIEATRSPSEAERELEAGGQRTEGKR